MLSVRSNPSLGLGLWFWVRVRDRVRVGFIVRAEFKVRFRATLML